MQPTQAQVDQALNNARGWKYAPMGNTPGSVDCVGFAVLVLRELGVNIPNYNYPEGEEGELFFYEHYHERFEPIAQDSSLPGDLVFIKIRDDRFHLGINAGAGRVAHCMEQGVVQMTFEACRRAHWDLSFYRVRES